MTGADRGRGEGLTYADAGVDIDAGNRLVTALKPALRATARPGADAEIGGFGGLFDLRASGYRDPILVAANDGVGTKLRVAIEAGMHETIGIDLVAMCVNDIVVQGAEPLFFLDYFACGKLSVELARQVIESIARGCVEAGCALIGGETAEMPGMYGDGDYDLAGFAVGAVERGGLLPSPELQAGDALIGIASSGLHSNGFSLVRKILARSGAQLDAASPFDSDRTLARALLVPTRIYVRPVLTALRETGAIRGLAHITGGGLVENVPRMLRRELAAEIDLDRIVVPPVFSWLAGEGGVSEAEMVRTFNCGIGMVAAVAGESASAVIDCLAEQNCPAGVIGRIAERGESQVQFQGRLSI